MKHILPVLLVIGLIGCVNPSYSRMDAYNNLQGLNKAMAVSVNVYGQTTGGAGWGSASSIQKAKTIATNQCKKYNPRSICVIEWENNNYVFSENIEFLRRVQDKNKSTASHSQNMYQELVNAQGDRYFGEIKNGKAHGQGSVIYANGDEYEGGWREGKMYGQGTVIFSDGSKYVGEWKDGNMSGQGKIIFADGGKYFGEFKNNKFHGQGKYTTAQGSEYLGEWKEGVMHGQGSLTDAIGNKFVGEFENHMIARGTLTCVTGDKYLGDFQDSKVPCISTPSIEENKSLRALLEKK